MAEQNNMKVRIQTMSRSEYIQSKHIPNSLPSVLIPIESSLQRTSPTNKPHTQNEDRVIEDEEEIIISQKNEHPKEPDSHPVSTDPPFSKPRREEAAHRAGFELDDPHEKCNEQINALQQQNQELQRKLDECLQHRKMLEDACNGLATEKDQYEQLYLKLLSQADAADRAKEFEKANSDLRAQLDRLLNDADGSKKRNARLEAENEALRQAKDLLESQVERLSNDAKMLENYRKRIHELEDENSQLKGQLSGIYGLLEEKNKEIQSLAKQVSEGEGLRQLVMQWMVNYVLLAAEVERLHGLLQEMKDAYSAFENSVADKDVKIVLLSAEVERLRDELELVSVNPELMLEKDVKLVLIASENERLQEELRARTGELMVLKEIKGDRSGELKKSIELEKERELADHQLMELKQGMVTLGTDIHRLQLENSKYQRDYNDLEMKYNALESSYKVILESLKTMKNSQSNLLSDSQVIAGAWNEEKKALTDKATELRYKNMKLEEMAILYMVEIERLHGKIEQLTIVLNQKGY